MFAGNFAPAFWAFCDGSLQAISENTTLFSLVGTTYGGDGVTTFALPDLRGRLPLHQGTGPGLSTRVIGELSGVETVTLTSSQIPNHTHALLASSDTATLPAPTGSAVLAHPSTGQIFASNAPAALMAASLGNSGGSQPHDNMQPYLCVSFIISLFGIFPPKP